MLVRVADRLRVLGQVVRLRLVEQLRAGEATPQELADTLGLTQQNVSKHLQVLHRSGSCPGGRTGPTSSIASLVDEREQFSGSDRSIPFVVGPRCAGGLAIGLPVCCRGRQRGGKGG
jgi:DNA-binding transcriptional ArsR family regulator